MDYRRIALHNVELDDLVKVVDSCKGNVYLETEEGDSLNLKSKLCQMLGISIILANTEISQAWVRCEDPGDESKLFRFDLYGEMPDKK
ncbi:MAG: hypothetical protein IKZ47_03455 [Clostridia bacterium]|nr:hypothetical protein [Clostridia bacterium]